MRVVNLGPQMDRILKDWSAHSSTIKRLQGKHTRFEYSTVFKTMEVAVGNFYYQAPDKGRIDLEGANIKKVRNRRKGYQVIAAPPERWICDGKRIMKIDDKEKSVDVFEVPPQARNQNIMDGPLPFLLGMPPDKAKKRFKLKLRKETATQVVLVVEPKWQQDAANWSKATVILDKNEDYLPVAIQMFDPAGTRETVYSFKDLTANKRPFLEGFRIVKGRHNELFDPPLKKYKKNLIATAKPKTGTTKKVPRVVGLPARQAKDILKEAGFQIKWKLGDRPPTKKKNLVISKQLPRAGTKLKNGDIVRITYYGYPRKTVKRKPKSSKSKTIR